MIKLNKLAMGVAMAAATASTGAFAGTLSIDSDVQTVGVEAATTGTLKATAPVNAVELTTGDSYEVGERVYIKLNDGATFADTQYRLFASAGADSSGFSLVTANPVGQSEIEFRVASALTAAGKGFVLSGSSAGTAQVVTVNVPSAAAGSTIGIQARGVDVIGTFDVFTEKDLFSYANQFSGSVDATADAVVDVNENRLLFTGSGDTDVIGLDFVDVTTIDNGVSLNDDDKVDITLSGDMSGIKSIMVATDGADRGTMTIDEANGVATFSASASDAYMGAGSTTLTATVWGSSALATRSFTVAADLNFDAETDKNLIASGTSAGAWDINGLQAKVSHMSLNVSGFVSWLKVVNEGTTAAEITADVVYTLADGTEGKAESADMGTVDAGGIATVSEAAILAAIGNPTQLVDAHITVTVAGQVDKVHLTAEKKASNGRVAIPVYYNREGMNKRSWVQ